MITRTTKAFTKSKITGCSKIIDVGCKTSAWEEATTVLDLNDYSNHYANLNPPKQFIQGDACQTDFEDNQFDFVIASHIIEHIPEPDKFLGELSRIAKAGYIEFPSPLFDNLIRGNETEHKWFVIFDDITQTINFYPKVQILSAMFTAREAGFLESIFPNNLTTAVYWEGSIEFKIHEKYKVPDKIPKFWKVMPKMASLLRLLKLHKS